MANLNLTHSGNMNITSASIGPGGTLDVQYEPNDSGYITGWTTNPAKGLADYDYDETLTVRFTPQFSGTVLSETFVVSGYDEAGVRRSDTSVLKQGFDTDVRHYLQTTGSLGLFLPAGCVINSSAATANYIDVNITVTTSHSSTSQNFLLILNGSGIYKRRGYTFDGYIETPTPTVITSLDVVVPDEIIGYGQASAVYTPSSATVNLVYSLENNDGEATIDPVTGEITVLTNGDVWVCVRDTISDLSSCKHIIVTSSDEPGPDTGITGNTFCVYYNVTSTTEPTWIGSYAYSVPPGDTPHTTDSQFVSARLADGTDVPLVVDNYAMYYTFPETGVQRVFYTVTENAIPDGAFAFHPDYTPYPVTSLIGVETFEDITTIGYDAFFNIGSLRSLIIPNVTHIGPDAFLGCTGLTGDLVLPDGFEKVEAWSFDGCTGLTSITFPSTFAYLTEAAFFNCSSLTAVTFLGEVPPTYIGVDPSSSYYEPPFGRNHNFPIYVPCQSLMAYREAYPYYANQMRCSGEVVTALTLSIAEEIVENGVAIPIISPEVYQPLFEFTSSNPEVATIDSGGNITVLTNGLVTFCVTELGSGLSDCKTVRVRRAVYIDDINIIVPDYVVGGTASATYTPSDGTVSLVYSSSNPEIVSIDPSTGAMTVSESGTTTITVRDVLTNKSDSKTVTAYESIDPSSYTDKYLTFEIINGGNVILKSGLATGITIDVRINGGSWQTKKPKSGTTVNIAVVPGDKLEFKASRDKYNHTIFGSSGGCRFNLSGNIMSILKQNTFATRKRIDETYAFRDLFRGCLGVVDAGDLVMPATALTNGCYWGMFQGCTNMTRAPFLPTTRGADRVSWCYRNMFYGCTNLSYVKCYLSVLYPSNGNVTDWLVGTATNGVFIKARGADTSNLQIPSTWLILDA